MNELADPGNLVAWNAMSKPPADALKTIKGGRLSGMTDINPTWRMKVMTEQYGPVGVGWWYTVDGFDKHDLAGEVALLARVTLYVKGHEHGIPGVGGSALVASEKSGMRLNDEAWKMAVTDALSVAMKALGVGAEIYMGNWDGSKYRNAPPPPDQPKADDELLKNAKKAALAGVTSYREFFSGLSKESRKLLAPHHEQLKSQAVDADLASQP